MSATDPPASPSSPPASEASSFSPYRGRLHGLTRRQLLDRKLKQSPRGSLSFAKRSPTTKFTGASSQGTGGPQAPTLAIGDNANDYERPSLVQRRAQVFGGTTNADKESVFRRSASKYVGDSSSPAFSKPKNGVAPMSPASDHDDKKSYFSGGGTTVTTATSSTTQPHLNGGYSALSDERSEQDSSRRNHSTTGGYQHQSSSIQESAEATHRQPQHLQAKRADKLSPPDASTNPRYYRIVYRGVVSLLSNPDPNSGRSGAYLSYGEIVATRCEFDIDDDSTRQSSLDSIGLGSMRNPRSPVGSDAGHRTALPPLSPPRSVSSQHSCSVSSLDTLRTSSTVPNMTTGPHSQVENAAKEAAAAQTTTRHVIRVDEVLTGGYAVDGTDKERTNQNLIQTPKRSNAQHIISSSGPSALPLADSPLVSSPNSLGDDKESNPTVEHYGFLFTNNKNVMVAEPIPEPPMLESGKFLYKITSSSPLPILTGPCVDAPKTRAMVLPGSVHDVCLRLVPCNDEGAMFLRLSHRRGWIADRRISNHGGRSKIRSVPVVKEVTGALSASCDASTSSLSNTSLASSSVTAPGSIARRRHRPPRKRRDKATPEKKVPRQHGAATPESAITARSRKSERTQLTATSKKSISSGPEKAVSPSSNVSLLSEDSSVEHAGYHNLPVGVNSFDSTSAGHDRPDSKTPSLFLMKVNAPRGLKILDAPHFQVNNLIHGQQGTSKTPGSSPISRGRLDVGGPNISKSTNSIFQHTTPSSSSSRGLGSPAVFDGKTRTLPRGALFEASKRMEQTGASFNQGSGLIKLSDNSGWAIVPRQHELDHQYRHYHGGVTSIKEGEATRAFEEVGNAIMVDEHDDPQATNATPSSLWLRIVSRNGVPVSCPPASPAANNDEDTSPTSSTAGGSSIVSGGGSNFGALTSQDSDIASSVGSAFLDAVFRTPRKKETARDTDIGRGIDKAKIGGEKAPSNIVPCGMCVEVDNWDTRPGMSQDYVRLVGGQGWIPRQLSGKPCAAPVGSPDVRFGSFWFRVQPKRGIKVRGGPSRKAVSIKSEDGAHFRFECGEFLRACEVMTVFDGSGTGTETFAKLYRNRHILFLKQGHEHLEHRLLPSMTAQAEWVQVHSNDQLYLEECGSAPRIQRHRQGWRYNAVHDGGIQVRRGPSFTAEETGVTLLGGESVVINERVTAPGEQISWLRLRDGEGWVHDVGLNGEIMMIAHSLHDRTPTRRITKRPIKPNKKRPEHDEAAYNTIIARLFHGDAGAEPRTWHTNNL